MKSSTLLITAAIFLALSSCAGPSFNRDWKKAVADYETSDAKTAVVGPWTGTWLSDVNQHTGDLRCLVTPVAETDDVYQFRYRATWARILRGGFKTEFPVRPDGKGNFVFDGEHDLGMFGKFGHKGEISGETFKASYTSSLGDHGTFEMDRP